MALCRFRSAEEAVYVDCNSGAAARWRIQLTGNKIDLEDLYAAQSLPQKVRIERDGDDKYFLLADQFETLVEPKDVLDEAGLLLLTINSAAKLFFPDFQHVHLSHVYRMQRDGRGEVFVFLEDSLHLRSRLEVSAWSEGKELFSLGPVSGLSKQLLAHTIQLAEEDRLVAKVLRLLGKGSGNWHDLYNVLEVIQADVGGSKAIQRHGWTTGKQLDRFKRTASSPEAAGDLARHGVQQGEPPSRPLEIDSASRFVRDLTRCWLKWKFEVSR